MDQNITTNGNLTKPHSHIKFKFSCNYNYLFTKTGTISKATLWFSCQGQH